MGASSTLIKELKYEDIAAYRNLLRMDVVQFDNFLQMIYELIKKEDTQMRMAIPPKTKLEVTLRYLATGDSFKSLEYLFRVPECTISHYLYQKCLQRFLKSWKHLSRYSYTNIIFK